MKKKDAHGNNDFSLNGKVGREAADLGIFILAETRSRPCRYELITQISIRR